VTKRRDSASYLDAPDGRYFVVRGRLWRKSNPALDDATRERLVKDLMSARRAVRDAKGDPEAIKTARHLVDQAKVALDERGPTGSQVSRNRLSLKQQGRFRR
jgi:hypothetical protein